MEYCNYGKVIVKDLKIKTERQEYWIVVKVNENALKIKSKNEYLLLKIDDKVIVFSIEGHKKYILQKNDLIFLRHKY